MNSSIIFREDHWSKIVSFLDTQPGVYAGQETSLHRFLEGVLWILRSGAQWRLLPEAYGNWNSVYRRFARWCEQGIWQALHQHFAKDPDIWHIILDSTIVRAHPCAAGALNKTVGNPPKPSDEDGEG